MDQGALRAFILTALQGTEEVLIQLTTVEIIQ
jgi:hypothetical protein